MLSIPMLTNPAAGSPDDETEVCSGGPTQYCSFWHVKLHNNHHSQWQTPSLFLPPNINSASLPFLCLNYRQSPETKPQTEATLLDYTTEITAVLCCIHFTVGAMFQTYLQLQETVTSFLFNKWLTDLHMQKRGAVTGLTIWTKAQKKRSHLITQSPKGIGALIAVKTPPSV